MTAKVSTAKKNNDPASTAIRVTTKKYKHYMTIIVSPSGIIQVVGKPPFSLKEAINNHEMWVKKFKEYGPIKMLELSTSSSDEWSEKSIEIASSVQDGLYLETVLERIVDDDDQVDNLGYHNQWKTITGKFIVTDIETDDILISTYFSLNEDGAKQARLSIKLRAKCIGANNLISYYHNRSLLILS
jgi:hypothetical protein